MKLWHGLAIVAVAFVGLYAWYNSATYSGPSGAVPYKGTCSFTDWLTRKCSTPYSNAAGIGVS